MRKQKIMLGVLCACLLLGGCAGQNAEKNMENTSSSEATSDIGNDAKTEANGADDGAEAKADQLQDGTYTAKFDTDSSMFRVNEACDGKGKLVVKNGEMTIHISLVSKKILNLYRGLAKDAEKDGAELLQPTEDVVTYSDGTTEEVYGFDVPVPVLNEEFDLALVGTKGKWYDHKVSVSDPQPMEDSKTNETSKTSSLEDGTYTMDMSFEGGSGRASIASPVTITVAGGNVTATLQWSSPNYDYMLVDGQKYLPINQEGDSVFEIPVSVFDEPIKVIGDTVAMSKPHEIEYTLTFHSDTIKAQK